MSINDGADDTALTQKPVDNASAIMAEEAAHLLQRTASAGRVQPQQEPRELVFALLSGMGNHVSPASGVELIDPTERQTNETKPDGPRNRPLPEGERDAKPKLVNDLEVAKGTNDISDLLGKGARLVRGDSSDVLTLPSGYQIEVKKDNVNKDGVAMIVIRDASGKQTADLRISKTDVPIANINDGAARTMIRVTQNGQIEAIRTNGKTYKLVPPKLD